MQLALLFIGSLATLYSYVFGAPFFLLKKNLDQPYMWKVPRALPEASISRAPGLRLSYFGWDFEVPWNDLDPAKTRSIGKPPWQWQAIFFRSGRLIFFMRRPANYWTGHLPHCNSDAESLLSLLGPAASSDYLLASSALETTPDQLTAFTFRRDAVRLSLLLMIKLAVVRNTTSGMYAINTPYFKGFQYGEPGKSRIDDVLYSDRGGVEFDFRSVPSNSALISQPEINRVIQTVKFSGRGDAHADQQ